MNIKLTRKFKDNNGLAVNKLTVAPYLNVIVGDYVTKTHFGWNQKAGIWQVTKIEEVDPNKILAITNRKTHLDGLIARYPGSMRENLQKQVDILNKVLIEKIDYKISLKRVTTAKTNKVIIYDSFNEITKDYIKLTKEKGEQLVKTNENLLARKKYDLDKKLKEYKNHENDNDNLKEILFKTYEK